MNIFYYFYLWITEIDFFLINGLSWDKSFMIVSKKIGIVSKKFYYFFIFIIPNDIK